MQAPFYEDDVQCEVIADPTVIGAPLIFPEPITTSAPFLKFKTYLPVDADEIFVLGGDVVVVVDTVRPSHAALVDAHVLQSVKEVSFIYLRAEDATESDLEPDTESD